MKLLPLTANAKGIPKELRQCKNRKLFGIDCQSGGSKYVDISSKISSLQCLKTKRSKLL